MIGLSCGVDFTNRATELTDSQSIYVWVDSDTVGLQRIWYFIGKMDPCRWGTTVELLWLIPIRDARVWEGVCCPHWFPLAPWVSIFWNLWISQHTLWHAPGDGNINLQEFSKLVEPLGQIWLASPSGCLCVALGVLRSPKLKFWMDQLELEYFDLLSLFEFLVPCQHSAGRGGLHIRARYSIYP